MRIQLTLFGIEVFCLIFDPVSPAAGEVEDDDTHLIGGGETHNFERDPTPLDPTDHYGEWEDKLKFGFRTPKK
jgi:hypothetical protein